MSLKTRMWIETLLAGLATGLAVVTLAWPTWIEMLFDEAPDGGDGSAERAFALVGIIVALAFARMARRDRRLLGQATRG